MFILDPFTPLNNAYSLELPVHILHRACPPPLLQSKTDIKLCFGFLIVSGPRALCLSLSLYTHSPGWCCFPREQSLMCESLRPPAAGR